MNDYDISQAFKAIENELIDSMMRNFSRHRAEETKEGYNWSQWQAEQLKSLEQYRKNNAKKFNKQFSEINDKISEMLSTARANGNAHQEAEILQAIKDGFKTPVKPSASSTAEFFKVNDRKLNALIKATTDDLKSAETAILRMSNDKYRKAIFNAQVYANTGAGTYEKAVDMACRDMLRAGLNCVEYSNGARHTLSDYADMAILTANKRAYLYGEGEKRAEWGISTVVVNSRQGGCPDCAQYIGRVFVDDVYSNGKKSDGDYPLLSTAIAGGLFHPRCKDSTSTYYEGITTLKKVSRSELSEMKENEVLEQQKNHAENQAEKCGRIAKYSLDSDNKRAYANRAEVWQGKAEKTVEKLDDTVAKSVESGMGVRKEFVPAKTKQEATEFAKKYGIEADYSQYDISVANAVNETIQRSVDEFGSHAIDCLKTINKDRKEKRREGGYDSFTETLSLFSVSKKDSLFKMGEKTRKANQRYGDMMYFSANDDLHTIHHEFGHVIHFSLGGSSATAATELDREIISYMRGKDTVSEVSYYASTSETELVAECIAQYLSGSASETTNGIINILKKYASKA